MAPARSSRRQRLLIGGAALAFTVVAAYLALVIVSRVDQVFFPGNGISLGGAPLPFVQQDNGDSSGITEPMNFLVMGMDRRPNEGNAPSRSDTMIVLTVDPQSKSARMLGLPRDWLVQIPTKSGGTITDRINTAYITGQMNGYKGGGAQLAEDTIKKNLGINIDHYIIIDFQAFDTLIDALGGIEVDVPTALDDPYYSDTELPGDYFPLHFEPGKQQMDGKHALGYARSRNTTSDLDRIQRQERIIFAAIDKASQLNVLASATDLWKKYRDTIDTDISDLRIPGLALLAKQIPKERITALTLGPAMYDYMWGDAQVLRDNPETLQKIVDAFVSGETAGAPTETAAVTSGVTPVDQGPVVVEVQNGTVQEGLAARFVDLLASQGYDSAHLLSANTPDGLRDYSEILNLTGKSTAAQRLAMLLHISADRIRTPTQGEAVTDNTGVDIVVVLGADTDLSALGPATSTPGG